MCSDDIECEDVCADTGGGGDIDSGIPTWMRLGGRGGGPICPFPDSWWAIVAIGFPTEIQLRTSSGYDKVRGGITYIVYSVKSSAY